MVELNLICEAPIIISLMGVLSFVSFSLGSLLVTQVVDQHGRRKSLIFASLLTPLCIAGLLLVKQNLTSVYVVISLLGLSYNCRSSTAYLYATEFLPTESHMAFAKSNFLFSGLFQIFSAVFFWGLKDQN